jgi:hypothetical protein
MARVNLTLSATRKIKASSWGRNFSSRAGCVDELTEFDNPAVSPGWTTRSVGRGAPISAPDAVPYAACARSICMPSILAIFGRFFFAACHRS